MFGDDNHFLSNQVGRVETHTKLTNHGDVSSSLEKKHMQDFQVLFEDD
jgi:hypothetical protein